MSTSAHTTARLAAASPAPERSTGVPDAPNSRPPSAPEPSIRIDQKLVPNESPGRIDRRAGHFAAEIARLHAEGYTLAAICRALAAVGIDVSTTTVRRELRRPARQAPFKGAPVAPIPCTSAPAGCDRHCAPGPVFTGSVVASTPLRPKASTSPPILSDASSSKDLAEAFFLQLDTNPLLRNKDSR